MGLTRGGANRTMYPFADTGPYYAVLLGAAGFDTNGGPSINEKSQIIDYRERPIPGLYGAGNCNRLADPRCLLVWWSDAGQCTRLGISRRANAAAEPTKEL